MKPRPIISEEEFSMRCQAVLSPYHGQVKSVMGPGRSGAIASVYASHVLHVPWIPVNGKVPEKLQPCLLIDTAQLSGRTLRKLKSRVKSNLVLSIFQEPPIVKFWYEK